MNKNELQQAGQDFKRTNDLPVSTETAKGIEKLALAHLAEGNSGMFKLAMSSLGKLQQTSSDSILLKALAAKILGTEEPEVPQAWLRVVSTTNRGECNNLPLYYYI